MRSGDPRSSVSRLEDLSIFTIAQTEADPGLGEFSSIVRGALNDLRQAEAVRKAAHEATVIALAQRRRADSILDSAVRDFAQAARDISHNDTHTPPYSLYFPQSSTATTAASPEVEVDEVRKILAKLEKETNPRLRDHVAALQAACDGLAAAVARVKEAKFAESNAAGLLLKQKVEWCNMQKEVYHRLQVHFRENPKMAEDFFDDDYTPSPPAAPADTAEETTTPASEPTTATAPQQS